MRIEFFFLFLNNFFIININYLFYKKKKLIKKQYFTATVNYTPQTDFQLPNSASVSLSCVRHRLQMME